MFKIITELNSIPVFDIHNKEITLKENYIDEYSEQITNYYFNCFPDYTKSENEIEEIENSEMIVEEFKIEENISKKFTKESNNKSEIISQKKENKYKEKSFSDLKSVICESEKLNLNFILTDNNEKSFKNYDEKIVKFKQKKSLDNKEKIEKKISIKKINDIKESKENKIFTIAKIKKIFKVVNPNEFYIFICGNKDKSIRKFINDTLKSKKFIIIENMEN